MGKLSNFFSNTRPKDKLEDGLGQHQEILLVPTWVRQ